jgi:putative ABC transport system permease protein
MKMRCLLRVLPDQADRRAAESELAELYELRRRQDGDRAAARWLRRQHLLYPLHYFLDAARAAVNDWRALMRHLWRDVSYSLRSLRRSPALTATIVLTVGIGLGATTAMVAVVRAVLINPLPYAAPDQLFWVYTDTPPFRFPLSVVDYRALEADHPALSAVAAYQRGTATVSEGSLAERVTVRSVTGSYFPLLGQRAVIGRLFDVSDDATQGDRVVVLSAEYWTRRFGSDPAVLGRSIVLDGTSHAIVGVLEKSTGPFERDVAVFTAARWPPPRRKGPFFLTVLGRLRPAVAKTAALDTLRATNARLFPIWKSSYQDDKATWGLMPLKDRVIGDVGSTLLVMLAAVACVLLIACVNAINLLVARALNRARELAIRSALGASRGRLLQHLMTESAVLCAGAALVGAAIAALAIKGLTAYGAGYIPRLDEVRLSGFVLGWLAALAAASGALIFIGGLLPVIHNSSLRVERALRSGGRSASGGAGSRRLRRALVAAEFALATPLVVAAVLVLASLDRLSRVSVGVDMERVLTASVSLSGAVYAKDSDRKAFWDRAMERLAALPGVDAVAVADSRPPREAGDQNNFDLEDHPAPGGRNQPVSTWVGVSPGFFKAAGLRLERGCLLDDRSLQDNVVVVDRAWADRFFRGQEVVGRRLKSGGCTDCSWTTVVGVVGTVKWEGMETEDQGTVYRPFVDESNGFFVLRTAGDPGSQAAALRRVVQELDPGLALSEVATGETLVSESLSAPRYLSVLVGMFALTALVLSLVGIYGVMAHFVQQQTRDIGIRLALGDEPWHVRRTVMLEGLRVVAVGVAIGLGAAFFTARLLTTVLFGVSATDARTMAGVPLGLLATAALACLVPGLRAARVDPAEILRET